MPESHRLDTIHAAVRTAGAVQGHIGIRRVRPTFYRHRRRTVHRVGPQHLYLASTESAPAARRGRRADALPARRTGRRHRAAFGLRHRRSPAGGTVSPWLVWGGDDSLRRPEAAGRPPRGYLQRCHALRYRQHAPALPAGCRTPWLIVRLRDRHQYRIPESHTRRGGREGGTRVAQLRASTASD